MLLSRNRSDFRWINCLGSPWILILANLSADLSLGLYGDKSGLEPFLRSVRACTDAFLLYLLVDVALCNFDFDFLSSSESNEGYELSWGMILGKIVLLGESLLSSVSPNNSRDSTVILFIQKTFSERNDFARSMARIACYSALSRSYIFP